MSCHSKWCSTLQAISQVAIAAVFIYAGLVVNSHMESWSESFKQGSEDLHSIRTNMNTIAYSMESINKDMDDMKQQVADGIIIADKMEKHMTRLNNNIVIISQQMDYMNHSVGGIKNRFSASGMMKSMMPF